MLLGWDQRRGPRPADPKDSGGADIALQAGPVHCGAAPGTNDGAEGESKEVSSVSGYVGVRMLSIGRLLLHGGRRGGMVSMEDILSC